MFAEVAAHVMTPLEEMPSAAFGLVLTMPGHAVGWAFPRGGAGKITESLAAYLISLGGRIETNRRVENVDGLPASQIVLFDITPRQILKIVGSSSARRLPE